MIYLVNYANDKYRKTQRLNTFTGKHIGKFKKILEFSPEKIDDKFKNTHRKILEIERGNGLWLWKPYFIKRTLEQIENGDIIFYCDSGAIFIRNKKHILKVLETTDIWVTDLPLIEKQFTKEDAFILMGCKDDFYRDSNQIQATFFALRKTDFTVKFVDEWLMYCCNKKILDGSSFYNENDKCFVAHREDQSILSLLCKKYCIKTYQDPTQYGRIPLKFKQKGYIYKPINHTKEYPVSIILHRDAKTSIAYIAKCILTTILPIEVVNRIIKHE